MNTDFVTVGIRKNDRSGTVGNGTGRIRGVHMQAQPGYAVTLRVCCALLAVVALPFFLQASTGCGFSAPLDPVKPTNSYGCACTCSPAPPRHRDLRVSFNEDDSEQQTNASILLQSTDLDFLNGRVVGLRFRDVQIPQGAVIDSANVEFTAAVSSNAGTLTVQIAAEAADDATAFTTTAGDLSARPKTANPVPWDLAAAWTVDTKQITPNFASVLQQVVNRPGWVEGNDVVLLFSGTAGLALRKAFSHDGQPSSAALLTVEYEEPVAKVVGPLDLQVCVLPVDNENIGGVAPDANRLANDCANRVQATVSGLAQACHYPSECSCSVQPDSQKYAGKCDLPCLENPVDMNCVNFDPAHGNVQATNAAGDAPVCVANSPLSSAMFGRRTTCAVEGNAHIEVDGDTRNPPAAGVVKFLGAPCPPGESCAVGLEYDLDIGSVTFGNFLKSATFKDLGSLGETAAGKETVLAPGGNGTFAPDAIAVSAQGRRGSDTRGLVTTNGDVVDVTVSWGERAPTCSVHGTLVGSVDPELKRCENAGPTANILCEDDSQCTADPGCSDAICNCEKVGDSEILLSLNVAGDILNQPPTADAGPDQEIECTNAVSVTNVVLDGSGSSDLDSNIALYSWLRGSRVGEEVGFDAMSKVEQSLGAETYVLRVIDAFGEADEDTAEVDVVDTIQPVVSCAVATQVVNQTNHNLVNVGLTGTAMDGCEGALPVTVNVFSDEDDDENTGDGKHSPDAKDLDVGSLRLRAERTGSSDGRVYLIVTEATDSSGNRGINCCTVTVPHARTPVAQMSAQGQATAAQDFCRANAGMPPAGYVAVGDGPTIGPKQ